MVYKNLPIWSLMSFPIRSGKSGSWVGEGEASVWLRTKVGIGKCEGWRDENKEWIKLRRPKNWMLGSSSENLVNKITRLKATLHKNFKGQCIMTMFSFASNNNILNIAEVRFISWWFRRHLVLSSVLMWTIPKYNGGYCVKDRQLTSSF